MHPSNSQPKEVDAAASARLIDELVKSLRRNAPKESKCIFLNCEMHLTKGGVTVSGDLFAITKPVLRSARRVQSVLSLQEVRLLDELGPKLMEASRSQHVILDLIVSKAGYSKFVSFEPLRRIGGDDDFFRSKHKSYVQLEPWLGRID